MPTIIKENYKKIIIAISVLLILPLLSVIINVIETYGQAVGSYARILVEEGISR